MPHSAHPSDKIRHERRVSQHTAAEMTRQKISDAVYQMIEQDLPVTVTAIARKAGVSRATFYTHFSGIEELAVYLHEDCLRQIADWQQKALLDQRSWRESEAQLESFRLFAAEFDKRRKVYSIIFSLPESSEARLQTQQVIEKALIKRVLKNQIPVPENLDIYVLAPALAAAYMHILSLWITDELALTIDEVGQYFFELMPPWLKAPQPR